MRAAVLLVLLLAAAAARSAPAPTPADAAAMAAVFETICLRAFPDRAATDAAAARYGGQRLAPAEVRELLHDDPGRGWRVQQPEATYLVTIEDPPWHACAVRRMTEAGLPTTNAFDAAVERYAATRRSTLTAPVSQAIHRPDGLDIRASARQVPGARGGVTDSLMLLLTDYHGLYDGPLNADAGRPGVEVRFVHQLRSPGSVP